MATYDYKVKLSIAYPNNEVDTTLLLHSDTNKLTTEDVLADLLEGGWLSMGGGSAVNLNSSSVGGIHIAEMTLVNGDSTTPAVETTPASEPEQERSVEDNYMYAVVKVKHGARWEKHTVVLPVDYDYGSGQEQIEAMPFFKDFETEKWVSLLGNNEIKVSYEEELTPEQLAERLDDK